MSDGAWGERALENISETIKDGTHGSFKRVSRGVPLLSAKNVTEDGRVTWDNEDDCVSEEDYLAIISSFKPQKDDVLITIVGTLGRRALFDGERVAFQRSVAFVRPDQSRVAPRFLYHAVGTQDFVRQLVRRSNATAQAGLYLGELSQTTIPLPPDLNEQRRIEVALDSVDEATTRVEAVIAKLQRLRAGLLDSLLTCGLDKDGELRDPQRHAELFQDSLLGQIPKAWDIGTVKNMAINCDAKRIPLKQADRDLRRGAFPYYGASGIIDRVNGYLFDGTFVLVAEDGENLRSRQLPVAFIAAGRFWVNNHAHILEPRPSTSPKFLTMSLNHQNLTRWLLGSAQPKLTQANLESIPLAIVPFNEQLEIVTRLEAIDDRIAADQEDLLKLHAIKTGLAKDLICGYVRIPERGVVTGTPA